MRALGLLTLLLALMAAPRGAAAESDHLKCYKIKDPVKLAGVLDLPTPQFGWDSGCTVSKAKLFCVPGAKTVVSAEDRATGLPITPLPVSAAPTAEDRICYKVRCDAVPDDQVVTDQFGTRTLTRFKAAMVCTPAVKGTAYCGDGTIDPGEDCEVGNLNGATCASEGFETGTLACGAGCVFDTSGCACAASAPSFPATGQTTCYSLSGSVIPCAGTGQDGEIQAGATLAYTDNGDGTITDSNTGLMWEKLSDDGSIHDKDTTYTFTNAFAVKVATLNSGSFAGHTDWRVPNAKELQSIVNYQNVLPAVSSAFNSACTGGCMVTTCSCTVGSRYWTSSALASMASWAWIVAFNNGDVYVDVKTISAYVRAVRGGS
jgi:hypothetical protein